MKKYLASVLILTCLGAFSLAQGTKTALFDVTKSQQEMEIMKGILSTTLSFVAQNVQRVGASTKTATASPRKISPAIAPMWRVSNMNAFYLYGQGAVFVMPTSSLRLGNYDEIIVRADDLNLELVAASRAMLTASEKALRGTGQGVGAGTGSGTGSGVPQAAQPPTPPAPPAPPQVNQEELRKKLAEAQDKVKKSREDSEASRAKFVAMLGEIKGYLIEALANHGDSLTTVKPNEYITLVILTDDFGGDLLRDESGPRTHQEVISVQKSWITDYKAGRLTLDAFKQKALQYSE
ncbi:MAG: hypothetical protein ABSH28_10655 [Acidobacteriota bacterium]|jgi:hypothetical protein